MYYFKNKKPVINLKKYYTIIKKIKCMYLPIVFDISSGDGVLVVVLLLASLLAHSIFAISVANQPGNSGIAHVIMKRIQSIICCTQTTKIISLNCFESIFKLITSSATIKRIVCVAVMSGNIRCTCPERPIRAQFTKTATILMYSMQF